MTRTPKSGNWGAHYDLTYDAWNRLVKVMDGGNTIAEYEYDGANRRIVKTMGADHYDFYHNENWQLLEQRKNDDSGPLEQTVYHPEYVDAVAVRYYDANLDGTADRQHYLQDANYNVTALLDDTGDVLERYEYRPYGERTVLDADFSDDADGASDYGVEARIDLGHGSSPARILQLGQLTHEPSGEVSMSLRLLRLCSPLMLLAVCAGCPEPAGQQTSKPQPAPQASAETGQAASSPAATESDFDEVFDETFTLTPQQAQRLSLPDGVQIDIPAQALAANSLHVTKQNFSPRSHTATEPFSYYELSAGGMRLSQPVTLRFPLKLPSDVDPDDVRVLHYFDDGKVEELAGTYDATSEQFAVETTSFSGFSEPIIPGDWFAIAEALSSVNPVEVHLRPRYYRQFDYMWCWATSFAMLVGSHKGPIHPQDVADLYSVEKSDGFAIFPILGYSLTPVQNHPAAKGLTLTAYRFGGLTEGRLRGFLIEQLNDGKPVWLGLPKYKPKSDHIIVVVGYRWNGFIIHDPSGALFAHVEGITGNDPQREAEYANYFIPFDRWQQLVNAWNAQAVVIEQPLPEGSARLSLQIAPGEQGVTFSRTGISFINRRLIHYFWNTKASGGSDFSDKTRDVSQLGMEGLCNSDLLSELNVLLHNTGDSDQQGMVRVWLDGIELGPAKDATIAANQVNQNCTVYRRRGTERPATPPPPYVAVNTRSTLEDGLNFNQFPLPLGEHKLEVGLFDASGQAEIDREVVVFSQLPAIVPRATVEPVAKSSGRELTHIVRFQHSPETARLTTSDFGYEVWRTVWNDNKARGRAKVATLDGPFDGPPRVEVEVPTIAMGEGTTLTYQVVAVHRPTGLKSPLNQPSLPADSMPRQGPVRYALAEVRYVVSARKGGQFEDTHGTLTPASTMPYSTGAIGPYEIDFQVTAPDELLFAELVECDADHQGNKRPGGKRLAIGLQDAAKFALARKCRVTKTNDREVASNFNAPNPVKEIYALGVESGLTLMNFRPFTQAQKNETKDKANEKYGLNQTVRRYEIPQATAAALLKNNGVAARRLISGPLVIGTEVVHSQRSDKPLEVDYTHQETLSPGFFAETMRNVMLPDADFMESYDSQGQALLVQMRTSLKQQLFTVATIDFYLVYVHQP